MKKVKWILKLAIKFKMVKIGDFKDTDRELKRKIFDYLLQSSSLG
jgi:hypothetical protein